MVCQVALEVAEVVTTILRFALEERALQDKAIVAETRLRATDRRALAAVVDRRKPGPLELVTQEEKAATEQQVLFQVLLLHTPAAAAVVATLPLAQAVLEGGAKGPPATRLVHRALVRRTGALAVEGRAVGKPQSLEATEALVL